MSRIRKISFAVTAVLMLLCLLLSATDLVIREDLAEVKKVSVYVTSADRSYLADLKRGILEKANESRVDVNYVTAHDGGSEDAYTKLMREYQDGSQAVILVAETPEGVRKYIREEFRGGPVITVNTFGVGVSGVPSDISFDVKGAAAELADTIQKEHGTEAKTILLTGEEGISVEIGQYLKEAFAEKGMETASLEAADIPDLPREQKEESVFIGCWISETEQAAEYLEQETLYGVGYSGPILKGIREGKIAGAEAFSMYAIGICAMQQAIAVIEKDKAMDIQIQCRLITKENIEEEAEFLVPIY